MTAAAEPTPPQPATAERTLAAWRAARSVGLRPARWTLIAGTLAALLTGASSRASSDLRPFYPAPTGCAMVHCDGRMTDLVRLPAPDGPDPIVIAHDAEPTGVSNPFAATPVTGNGCASNGRVSACAYSNAFGHNVVAYDYTGARLWTSGALLNESAFASVPMIDSFGDVVAADDSSLIRFGPAGDVLWHVPTPGGVPISPVPTSAGGIVLATWQGPLSLFDSRDGRRLGILQVTAEDDPSAVFDTSNTPCIVNDRLYVSMVQRGDPDDAARLVAIDVDTGNAAEPLKVAWHVPFGGPSGASPLCVGNTIYFDGGRASPGGVPAPHLFAVRDDGNTGTLLWARQVAAPVPASFARDPRGGFWVEIAGSVHLQRRSFSTGAVLESLDIRALVGDPNPNIPWSVLSITGPASAPVMIVGTLGSGGLTSYVIAVDLTMRSLKWKVNISPAYGVDNASVQFPVMLDPANKPVLVFASRNSGAFFVRDR